MFLRQPLQTRVFFFSGFLFWGQETKYMTTSAHNKGIGCFRNPKRDLEFTKIMAQLKTYKQQEILGLKHNKKLPLQTKALK